MVTYHEIQPGGVLRARQPEDKAKRRELILAAADALLDISRNTLPSVAEIAEQAGFAKGTIYTYFRTKEEIYLALLANGFICWVEVVKHALSTPEASLDSVLNDYIGYCADHPKVLFLASLAPTILEQNIPYPLAYEFKSHLANECRIVGSLMSQAFEGLDETAAVELFLASYAMTLGVWQLANPAPVIRQVTECEELMVLRPDFSRTLYNALRALWLGSIMA